MASIPKLSGQFASALAIGRDWILHPARWHGWWRRPAKRGRWFLASVISRPGPQTEMICAWIAAMGATPIRCVPPLGRHALWVDEWNPVTERNGANGDGCLVIDAGILGAEATDLLIRAVRKSRPRVAIMRIDPLACNNSFSGAARVVADVTLRVPITRVALQCGILAALENRAAFARTDASAAMQGESVEYSPLLAKQSQLGVH